MQALKFGEETLSDPFKAKARGGYMQEKMYKSSRKIGMPGGGGKNGFPYNYELEGMLYGDICKYAEA